MVSSQGEIGGQLRAVSDGLAAAVEKVGASVVALNARPRVPTSGVVWREGVVVSTNHTVQRDEEITVMLPAGGEAPATLVGRDPSTDLAVLRVEGAAAAGLKAAEVGDADALRVGHLVLAVGRVGLRGVSAGLGIVGAAGGAWRTGRGGEIDRFLRLDLGIFLGFSGGALADAGGRVVGVNTSAQARGGAMTIPASTVTRVVEALLQRGHIARGYLGIGTSYPVRLPEKMREELGLPAPTGLIILSVDADGPAGRAGLLLLGDVLVALDDAPTRDIGDVQAALSGERVGQGVKATIVRGGAKLDVEIIVGEHPRRRR